MALILKFREMHGEVPRCNIQGKNKKPATGPALFSPKKLKTVIEDLS